MPSHDHRADILYEEQTKSTSFAASSQSSHTAFWIVKDGRIQKEPTIKPVEEEKTVMAASSKPLNNRSYVHGAPNHNMVFTTMGEMLEKRSEEMPDKEAHVFWSVKDDGRIQREAISFSVLSERSSILAGNFLSMGLKAEDRIAIIGENCPEWVYVEYAALRTKMCLVRLHSSLVTAESVRRVVFEEQCRAVVVSPGADDYLLKKVIKVIPGMRSVDDLLRKLPNMRLMVMGEARDDIPVRSVQELTVSSESMEEVIKIQDTIEPHDIAIAYSTSGTSGFPKFVAMTHYSYINNVIATSANLFQSSDTRFCNDRPFTWIGSGLHSAVCLGISIVHIDAAVTQNPSRTGMVLGIMEEERITVTMAMATVMTEVQENKKGEYQFPPSCKHVISGGEPLSNDMLAFCKERFDSTILLYASSESFVASRGIVSTLTPTSRRPYALEPLPHVEMKVTDEEQQAVPVGQPGKLWVRSPYLFESYLNFEHSESKILFHKSGGRGQGLWFNTEDLAIIDEKGRVEVVGRQSDVIVRDGEDVYPYIYENVLREYPKVSEVFVIGVPDKKRGNEVCVVVSFKRGYWVSEEGLIEYMKRKKVEPLPKYVLVVDNFPHNNNGKMDRKALKKMVNEKFDLDD